MATMAESKRDFENGIIRGFRIERVMGKKVVVLLYVSRSGISEDWLDDARTKTARQFKTYDAAVSALEQVGFSVDVIGS